MPIWHEEHRGYRISYQGDLVARIARPGSELELALSPRAEPGEGRAELRHKAHAAINADLAENAKAPVADG
jgi:hypothetical protein